MQGSDSVRGNYKDTPGISATSSKTFVVPHSGLLFCSLIWHSFDFFIANILEEVISDLLFTIPTYAIIIQPKYSVADETVKD